jgi:hypothetical protein
MANQKAQAASTTKLNNHATKDAPVETLRSVTYIFDTIASNVNIPYAVAVDGVVQSSYKDKPKRVSGANGKIVVSVKPGAKVTLYLNSDAHPSYRQNAVYEVSPNDHDIKITITEKAGKHSDPATPTLTGTDQKNIDTYTAPLTGDIWMTISHKYTAAEVDGLVPAGTSAEVTAAVKSIYEGLSEEQLTLSIAATADKAAATIVVTFADSSNPKQNIVSYSLLTDGLTRVHPGGYAALFNAAVDAGVTKLTMSSAWRPMLGSIAHRAGLGLDVSYLGDTQMNRQELRKAGAVDTTNVSPEEKTLLLTYETAKANETKAKKEAAKATAAYMKVKSDSMKAPAAKDAADKTQHASKEATDARTTAEKAWNEERDKNEPAAVRAFRKSLLASPRVTQLFDPWFMDNNTTDNVAATPNMQKSGNEALHSHHLHITVKEPKIL